MSVAAAAAGIKVPVAGISLAGKEPMVAGRR